MSWALAKERKKSKQTQRQNNKPRAAVRFHVCQTPFLAVLIAANHGRRKAEVRRSRAPTAAAERAARSTSRERRCALAGAAGAAGAE